MLSLYFFKSTTETDCVILRFGSKKSRGFLIFMKSVLLYGLLFLCLPSALMRNQASAFVVSGVEVEGNKTVRLETILSYITFKNGENITESDISNQIKTLYDTDFFSDIEIEFDDQNGKIKIIVKETPVVASIEFNGLNAMKKEDLLKEFTTKEKKFYKKMTAITDSKRLEEVYKQSGYFDAHVNPFVEFSKDDRVKVIFDVREDGRNMISKIMINGNDTFADSKILEIARAIREETPFRPFSKSKSTFDPQVTTVQMDEIRKFYADSGYAKANVWYDAILKPQSKKVLLNVNVHEGQKFTIEGISFKNTIVGLNLEIEKMMQDKGLVKSGDVFNASRIENMKDEISQILQKNGFLFAEVGSDIVFDDAKRTAKIEFTINNSNRIYVRKINISGNIKTNDNVIRREFLIHEGDVYNSQKLKRSIQRLRNLGYFSDVQVHEKVTDDQNKVDLDIAIVETSTAQLSASVGYQVGNNMVGNVAYNQSNFLGMGYGTNIMIEKTSFSDIVQLSFVNPYIFGKDIAVSSSIDFNKQSNPNINPFNISSQAANLSATYSVTEYLRHSVHYSLRYDNLSLFSSSTISSIPSRFITEQLGSLKTSSIGQVLFYDKRDNAILPSGGYSLRFSQNIAGLGGNIKYISHEVGGEYHIKTFKRDDLVLSLKFRGGYISGYSDANVNIKDRYFLGGTFGMRGFDFRGIGPRVKDVSTGVYDYQGYGGKGMYVGSLEFRFPNFLPKDLGFVTYSFVDFGSVFGSDDPNRLRYDTVGNAGQIVDSKAMRASYGIGLNWKSPMGLIGFTFATPFKSEIYDTQRRFLLNIGGMAM